MKRITKEELDYILIDLNKKYNGISENIINKYSNITRRQIRTHYGSMSNARLKLGLKKNINKPKSRKGIKRKTYSKEEALNIIKDIELKYGYFSKGLIDYNGPEYGRINHKVINRIWGSFKNLYTEEKIKEKPKTKGIIIKEDSYYIDLFKNYCKKYNIKEVSPSSIKRICSEIKMSSITILKRFGTEENFCNIIGINLNKKVYTNEKITIDIVSTILNEKPILQYRTFSVKNIKTMPIDAYFKNHNIALEYNGRQHYEYVQVFHKNIENFKKQKYRDSLKYKKIIESGMKLLIIKHNDRDEDIIKKVNKILNS